jgi:hypothetical protein
MIISGSLPEHETAEKCRPEQAFPISVSESWRIHENQVGHGDGYGYGN